MHKHIIALFFMLFLTAAQPLAAQSKTYTIRAAATGILHNKDILWMKSAGKNSPPAVPVRLNTRAFTKKTVYKGNKTVNLYLSESEANAKKPPKPVAKHTFSSNRVRLLFAPQHQTQTYNVYEIPLTKSIGNSGAFIFVNFSKHKLKISLGKQKSLVLPNFQKSFHFTGGLQNGIVKIELLDPKTKEIKTVRSSRWSIAEGTRELVLIYPNPQEYEYVRFKHFYESGHR